MVFFITFLLAQAFAGPLDLGAQVQDSAIRFNRGRVSVTLLAGNIMELNTDAAAFPAGKSGGGDELIVGSLMREGGAEPGFLTLEKMLKEKEAELGTVQIVEAGGGRFKFLINAVTQECGRDGLDADIDRVIKPGQKRGDVYAVLSHVREQRLIAKTMNNLLTDVAAHPEINSVAVPMFGTGSFHGMHPFLSLISSLAGVEKFARNNFGAKNIELKIVWYGRPGDEATKFFREKVLPAIQWGLQEPEGFEKLLNALWTTPISAEQNFSAQAKNPGREFKFSAPELEATATAAAPPPPRKVEPVPAEICDTNLKGETKGRRSSFMLRIYDFFDDLL